MRERIENDLLETVKSRISERLKALGMSANEASSKAGLGLSYVNDILTGRSKKPTQTLLDKLATEALACSLDYLLGRTDTIASRSSQAATHEVIGGVVSFGSVAMKLYTPGLPDDGHFTLGNRISGFESPISGDPQYAVSVPDDSNAPRYVAGEIVIVDPQRPLSRNGFALVTTIDGRSVIGRVLGIASDKIALDTLSGQAIEIQRNDVRSAHRIIASFG